MLVDVDAAPPLASSAMRFAGRIAVVTGAASGIGKATALRLGREGAAVAAVDRHLAGAEETAAALRNAGSTARAYACDVADSAQVAAAAQAIERDLGPVDVLANVAGIGDAVGTDITELDDARWNQVLAVNLSGAFFWCRALLPGMAARARGAVVSVSSLAGRSKSANGGPAYTASKAGVLGLTRHLAFDYGPRGVRVNAICPGGVDTPLLRAGRAHENAEERSTRLAAYGYFMPIKRVSTPDEQAAAIAFLASDDASYINGVSLDVNGGLYMA
ncbi:MAG: SDR family oxidoreductase [Deltaproteobacteria bacterium]|nr:MAG: SDR family oxidoreductase [Deltaproteobacteria bacterium]TMB24932.1 MAG: SDR family oxidoreductase [Deltaproteobacteria bacterium]